LEGIELVWFKDYRSNRTQVGGYQSFFSDPCALPSGVPQGSILGPLFFVLFINDLPDAVLQCSILLYVDDAVIFFTHRDAMVIEKVLNEELVIVNNWTHKNFLFLNKHKTEVVIFGMDARISQVSCFKVYIGNYELTRVSEFKYLGIVLDENVSWKAHVKYLITKGGKRVGMLGRLQKNLTVGAANTLYKLLIVPIFYYCDSVWSCCNKCDTDGLERLQRQAAKIVAMSSSSDTAMQILKWVPLETRRDKHVCTGKLVKKCLTNNVPRFLRNYFTFNRDVVPRIIRQSNCLRIPQIRTEAARTAFFYNGALIYKKSLN